MSLTSGGSGTDGVLTERQVSRPKDTQEYLKRASYNMYVHDRLEAG